MSERRKDPVRLNKTSICSVVFLDIVGYSKKPDSEQIKYKDRFNALVSEALKNVAQNDRIILDTGDGAAITLLGEPESAVFISLTIRDGILESNRNHPDSILDVRIGINLGPVQMVRDINNHLNIIGDGINVAQRVMSFAEPNQILVSRSYYEIVSRLSNDILKMFSYSGIKHDKHVREHEVYVLHTSVDTALPVGYVAGEPVNVMPGIRDGGLRKLALAIGLALLVIAAVTAFLWSGKKASPPTPSPPKPAMVVPSPSPAIITQVPPAKAVEEPTPQKPQTKADARKKKQKPKPDSRKKTQDSAVVEQTPRKASTPAANETPKTNDTTASQHSPPPEHKAHEEKKSGLDKPRDNVKQGTEKPGCEDVLRSLNQCK